MKIPGTDIEKPEVELVGGDSNAGAVMYAVSRALKKAGAPKSVVTAYRAESMSGDYNHLLRTAMKYAEVS